MSKLHWAALSTAARLGGRTVTRLLQHFGSLEAALGATEEELRQIAGIGPAAARAIKSIDLAVFEVQIAAAAREGIQIVTWEDAGYPSLLLHSSDAPPVLYVRGALSPADSRAVAVVGTRSPGPDSADLAHQIAYELAARGWTIVSGLAIGIDTAAHQGALRAGGRTLAVLGSGLRAIYPQRNVPLAEAIMGSGALLAEVHPDAPITPQTLVARNRITSGLSRAVIVVQSEKDSGSLATARRAWQQGRRVYAVLGSEGSGLDDLVRQGAMPLQPDQIDWDALSKEIDGLEIRPPDTNAAEDQLPLF
ncbi:MAG: hypothetical protein Kow00124_13140 [Anaerolineae bacterium]